MATLQSLFIEAKRLGTQTKIKKMRTLSGLKDTFQIHFIEKLFSSYKNKCGVDARQAALNDQISMLPTAQTKLESPVWRIKGMPDLYYLVLANSHMNGLNPHHDTPVEILHIVLLGFINYLWRNIIQNQLKNDQQKKDLLTTRLSSFNVAGLRILPLAGQTLVQYAGSLTGRDFCAISQAAPFVSYDLVPANCFSTWVTLSKLIPLIWQPSIENIDEHLVSLIILPLYLFLFSLDHTEVAWEWNQTLSSVCCSMGMLLVQQTKISHICASPRTHLTIWSCHFICNRGIWIIQCHYSCKKCPFQSTCSFTWHKSCICPRKSYLTSS